jgi:hypothetical protein
MVAFREGVTYLRQSVTIGLDKGSSEAESLAALLDRFPTYLSPDGPSRQATKDTH